MSEIITEVTKVGLSKSFGCCANWQFCELGKKECYYAERDPEVPKCCSAWRRNHLNKQTVEAVQLGGNTLKIEESEKPIEEFAGENQLSFFD